MADQKKTDKKKADDAQPAKADAAQAKAADTKAETKVETKKPARKPAKPKATKAWTTKKKAAETPPAEATSTEAPASETPAVEAPVAEAPAAETAAVKAPQAEAPAVAAKTAEPKKLTDLADLGAATAAQEAEAAAAAEAAKAAAESDAAASDEPKTFTDLADLGPAAGTPVEAPVYEQRIDPQGRAYATGKRKDAVARVWIKPGAGRVIVNDRDIEVFFARPVLRMLINQPFEAVGRNGQYDVMCTVKGGGLSGQAGAVRHGISKALLAYEPTLRGSLKAGGFLTRDARVVERKKYGKAKARRSFQFSKR